MTRHARCVVTSSDPSRPPPGGRALDDPLQTKQKYSMPLEYAKACFERIK
jgi:hypothetical protein